MVRVFLRVMGQTLFERITKELAALNSAFPRTHLHGKPINWQLEKIDPPLIADHLRHTSQGMPVVLLEANDSRIIDHLWVISNREFLGMTASQNHLNAPAPLIMFLPEDLPTTELLEMPPVVSDWVTRPSMHDTVRRIFSSLNRFHRFHAEVTGGKLTLAAETRMLCFSTEAIQLTPSEVAVAELFLHHFGSVIPLEEILLLFKLSGRSTEGQQYPRNHVSVAFQDRGGDPLSVHLNQRLRRRLCLAACTRPQSRAYLLSAGSTSGRGCLQRLRCLTHCCSLAWSPLRPGQKTDVRQISDPPSQRKVRPIGTQGPTQRTTGFTDGPQPAGLFGKRR